MRPGLVSLLVGFAAAATLSAPSTAETLEDSAMRVNELKTEHLSEPLGIETPHPRFRWLLDSTKRGQLQTAYQILVASSSERLQADTGDKWDSGKIASDNSVEIPYAGRALTSGERAYWKVRVWDENSRPTAYSAPSFFEMGLRRVSDWQGSWIAANKEISSPIFRREFSIDSPVRRARVYICGLGYYELSINGKKVGDRVLDPAPTNYQNERPFKLGSRVLYSTYDVTDALRTGANALGIMLGHGWFSAQVNAPAPAGRFPYRDHPQFILQMNVELMNGRTVNVVSDASWHTSSGPITYNDLADGETYDARLEQAGWDQVGFNGSSWEKASLADPPGGVLTAELLPPTKVMATLPVVKMTTPREPENQFFDSTYAYDFGQHFSGWVRLAVSGPRGAKLVIRYGSRLYPDDGTLDTRSNETPGASARQEDTYILKGEGTEVWEPRFALHGFRYVEVIGFSETPSVQTIEGRFVHSAVDSTGSFVSSDDLINKVHHNIQWTLMSSFQGIPQDAADRYERVGYLGDTGFVAEDYIHNYDMLGFFEKWLNDIEDDQKESGSIPSISPSSWGLNYEMWPSWQSTYPLLVWYLYEYYGDRRIVEEHYAHLKKLVDYMSSAAAYHLLDDERLGDHMEPQPDGYSRLASRHTSAALTANAYYYYNVFLLSRMAELLGQSSDAKRYRSLARNIKDAFNRRFFDPATNQYATGSQTSNALPLYMGLAPNEKMPAVLKNLVDDIVTKHNDHVSTGIIGFNAIVQTLPEHGAAAVMYRLATQTTYPSLGDQVVKGATTVCETYECGPRVSQNMKMFASLDKFFYRNLAGIRPASPGYRRVLIQPQPVGDLKTVTASQRTVRGTVVVDWIKGTTSFDLKVTIPAGMEADIDIPKLGLKNVQIAEGGIPVWKSNSYLPGTIGLTGAQTDTDSTLFHAGSGAYHFTLSGTVH